MAVLASLALPPPSLSVSAPHRALASLHRSRLRGVDLDRSGRVLYAAAASCCAPFFVGSVAGSLCRGAGQRLGVRRAVLGLQEVQELPEKLQEIVRLFEAVPDHRAKYEQLLHYAKQLKPLGKEYLTPENKVEGCVSQVWVLSTLGSDKRFYFEAESDSLLTKGLAALLVEGLSGSTPQEILKVTPDFVHMLGLKQSLTPSRSNGFLNMLKLMQKKTLRLYMESEASSPSNAPTYTSSATGPLSESVKDEQELSSAPAVASPPLDSPEAGTKKSIIEKKLAEALTPTQLEVDDVSHQHAGHAGVHKGATETHFNVKVVSESFEGRTLLKRHRLVYDLLQDELQTGGVHALSLITKTPREVAGKP